MSESKKECFGILDNVFPLENEGLREIVPSCFSCPDRVSCLQEALNTEQGLMFRCEVVGRSRSKGLAGRLKRWSEKKDLMRRLKQKGMNK